MIQAEQLTFSYTNMAPFVLSGLNLSVPDGAYVSVVGENGSGKSTLMRLLLGFLKPTSGMILTDAKRIGYVPQRSEVHAFPITVYEVLNAYRKLLHLPSKDSVMQALEQVQMTSFRNELIGNLSGGQRQKIMLIRAMMGDPDLLILDEPSTGVDIGSQQEIYRFIKELNVERGKTIISVEHNLDAAIRNSTSIYHLVNGKGHLCSPEKYAQEFIQG